jgi:hypothetical protein
MTQQPSPKNRPDINTIYLVVGGIIGAVIAAVIGGYFAWRPPPSPPTPTAPPPTATPIPSSAAEDVLRRYLTALVDKEFNIYGELTSHYSLEYLERDKEQIISDAISVAAQDYHLIGYEVVSSEIIDNDRMILFRIVLSEQTSDIKKTELLVATYKDDDGEWRVNIPPLIDYRVPRGQTVSNPEAGLTIKTATVSRLANSVQIDFDIDTNSGGAYSAKTNEQDRVIVTCFFDTVIAQGTLENSIASFKGFFDIYPTKCHFPGIMDSKLGNMPTWEPIIVIEY